MLDAILAGASGYVVKDITSGYVVKDIKGMEPGRAIKDVGAGKSLLDNRAAAALMGKLRDTTVSSDPLSGLTDQKRALLTCSVKG
jgi:two-component system response regulator DevR